MSDLRDRIAEALYQWTLAAAGGRRLIPPDETALRENSLARADAVLAVVEPEIAKRDAALTRVRELHQRIAGPIAPGQPDSTRCDACLEIYPCPTITAIDGDSNE